MRRLGVHTSIAGGLHLSLERACKLGCNTMQIFSHNPRGWDIKELSEKDVSLFKKLRLIHDITPVYIHSSYLINIASSNKALNKKSINLLIKEMDRADLIGADFVILHPGSASNEPGKTARKRAIDALNEVAERGNWNAGLLIENTSGERGDISTSIKDIAEIIQGVNEYLISGICIDTCHLFAAGYDIRKTKVINNISNDIERYIGFKHVKLIHLNDSKTDLGKHIDRHEHIGIGKIGIAGLRKFINYKIFSSVPLILETPKKTESNDLINIQKVKNMTNYI